MIVYIKKCYADLSSEQQELIVNYASIAEKEETYKDLLYAQAVTKLAKKCAEGEGVSPFEVYCAYNALTDAQKSYVDLHGVEPEDEMIPQKQDRTQDLLNSIEPPPTGCNGAINTTLGMATFLLITSLVICFVKRKKTEGEV